MRVLFAMAWAVMKPNCGGFSKGDGKLVLKRAGVNYRLAYTSLKWDKLGKMAF